MRFERVITFCFISFFIFKSLLNDEIFEDFELYLNDEIFEDFE
jgi:hypothetical protein